jgi:hypothetical protein
MTMSTKRLLALPRIRQARIFAVVAVALFGVFGIATFAQSVGTWKLNLAKSKYQQGQAPKSTTLKYEAAGTGIKVTVDTVGADGAVVHYAYTANYDGKDNSVVGNPNADMAARTRVDANTTKLVTKKDGKILANQTLVVSGDGKTLTITTKGTDAKGQNADSVAIYDKQ